MAEPLLIALLQMHDSPDIPDIYSAFVDFQAAWIRYCEDTELFEAASQRMLGPFREMAIELNATTGYLANAQYRSDFFQAGLRRSLAQTVAAFAAYARFWMGQVAIARVCVCDEPQIQYLESDCECAIRDFRDAIRCARQLRRSMDTHT